MLRVSRSGLDRQETKSRRRGLGMGYLCITFVSKIQHCQLASTWIVHRRRTSLCSSFSSTARLSWTTLLAGQCRHQHSTCHFRLRLEPFRHPNLMKNPVPLISNTTWDNIGSIILGYHIWRVLNIRSDYEINQNDLLSLGKTSGKPTFQAHWLFKDVCDDASDWTASSQLDLALLGFCLTSGGLCRWGSLGTADTPWDFIGECVGEGEQLTLLSWSGRKKGRWWNWRPMVSNVFDSQSPDVAWCSMM